MMQFPDRSLVIAHLTQSARIVVKILDLCQIYVIFVSSDRGLLSGPQSFHRLSKIPKFHERSFEGLKATLQFLWYQRNLIFL